MSLLLLLPTELQSQILGYLGAEFFRQDIHRLTVSRAWYRVAWRILVRHLQLSAPALVKFVQDQALLARSRDCVVSVRLSLRNGIESIPLASLVDTDDDIDWGTAQMFLLKSSYPNLATTLRRCPGLRRLELEYGTGAYDELGTFLIAQPLIRIISAGNLTHLDIDTSGQSRTAPSVHLCRSVNSLLPSLRRLRYRMGTICEKLLAPSVEIYQTYHLEEVIINLSLSEMGGEDTANRYAASCWSDEPSIGSLLLTQLIEHQATELASRLSSPRMVRVISHESWSLRMQAFDALTGQRMNLGYGNVPWDADEELVSEENEEDGEDEEGAENGADLLESERSSISGVDF